MKHRQGNDKYLETQSASPTRKGSIFQYIPLTIGRSGLLPLRPTATKRPTASGRQLSVRRFRRVIVVGIHGEYLVRGRLSQLNHGRCNL